MKRLAALSCALVLLTGCPEPRFHSGRIVSLTFPAQTGESKVILSAQDSQVQEALRIIDSVLVGDGFARDSKRPAGSEPNLVASYARFTADGLREVGTPDVYLKDNRLEIVIVELGNRTGRPSAASKKICTTLQKELSNRFGAQRVRVVNAE